MTGTRRASMALALGGVLWGLYWIPLRALEDAGVGGGWATLVLIGGAAVLSLPFARPGPQLAGLAVAGVLTGGAFALYSTSLLLTDIVRAMLLFYLTPIWGTLLGRLYLAEHLTPGRIAALVLSLLGLAVIMLGGGEGRALNLGDALALLSGLSWAIGTLVFHQLGDLRTGNRIAAFLIGAAVIAMFLLPLAPPTPAPTLSGWLWALPAALYVLPMVALTIWPTSILTPGRVGLILMTEVVVGVVSAGLFAGEVFGAREALGAFLIVSAAAVEVIFGQPERAPA